MTPVFENSRPRPVPTPMDALRPRLDLDQYDGVVFAVEAVATDLGYGDVRALPGAVAWIDKLRAAGKRTALLFSGERGEAAAQLAGISDRFDAILSGPRSARTITRAIEALEVDAARTLAVDVIGFGISAAHEAGIPFAIAVAHDGAAAEQLRRSGADTIVADLQELLAPLS